MRYGPMATMQARNYLMAIVDGIEAMKARKCIGLGCSSAPMATGRKHLGRFFAPIGGSAGLVGNNPVIWTIQILPCRMQVFRGSILSLFRNTDRDPAPGGDPLLVDVNTHIDEW